MDSGAHARIGSTGQLGSAAPEGPRRSSEPAGGRAGNGTRTRDINLGKVALYQLSYSRIKNELCRMN